MKEMHGSCCVFVFVGSLVNRIVDNFGKSQRDTCPFCVPKRDTPATFARKRDKGTKGHVSDSVTNILIFIKIMSIIFTKVEGVSLLGT
jgi:hypothetical protein